VPLVFTTRVSDVFSLPKLVVLWTLLVTVSLAVICAVVLDDQRLRIEFVAAVDAPVAAYVVLSLLALSLSTDRLQSLFGEALQHQGVLTTVLYVGSFYLARSLIRDVTRLRLLLAAVAAAATLVSAYAIVQRAGWDPIWHGFLPSGRVFSTIGQANALAAYLVLAIPITAALAVISTRSYVRIATIAAVAAMMAALAFTRSRGGYLGLALAASVIICAQWQRIAQRWGSTRTYAGAAIAVMVAVVAVAAPLRGSISALWHRPPRVGAVNDEVSVQDHLDIWRVAVEIIKREPLIGTGPETFPDQFSRYSPAALPPEAVQYFDQFRVESPHNQVMAVASGAGIPAMAAYVALLVGVARTLWGRGRRAADQVTRVAVTAIIAAGAGHLVTDSFMTADITGSWLFWTLTGAGLAAVARRRSAASRSAA